MTSRLWDKGNDVVESVDQAILEFTTASDLEHDGFLARYDAIASAAHARMLVGIGCLSEEECGAVLKELSQVYQDSCAGQFVISPELEDCHTAIETRLTGELGEAGRKIHTGRSRNDQVLVAMRLAVCHQILEVLQQLIDVAFTLHGRASEFMDIVVPGYTHTQKAMPTTVATLFMSYCQYSISLLQDGFGLYKAINWNPLGVGSGFGVPLELDRHHTTTLLGFDRIQPNPIFVQSTRGREELKFINWLCDIALLLERASSDMILFSTEEFGFVKLPEKFTTGSSIMPQKRNPDVFELLRAQGSLYRGARYELEGIVSKLSSSYHRDYQYTKDAVFRTASRAQEALNIFKLVMKEISFKEERARQLLTPDLFATHYAYELVSRQGVPFRVAYVEAAKALHAGKIDPLNYIKEFVTLETTRTQEEMDEAIERIVAGQELHHRAIEAYQNMINHIFILS